MSKILQLCPIHHPYHAVYFNPGARGEERLIYVDVPMFALVETGNGKIEVCPLIVLRNGEAAPAWETENYIGCAEVDVNDDDFWLDLHDEQEDERKEGLRASKASKKKGKGRTKASHSRRTEVAKEEEEQEEEAEEEEEDDEEPEGEVQLPGKRR